jgi:hypothetical protein
VGKTAMAIRFSKGYFEGTHTICPVQWFYKHVQVWCAVLPRP